MNYENAILYLKGTIPDDDESDCITLSPEDEPVFKNYGNGLLAAYLVDEGKFFSYVQYRHLTEAGISKDTLHNIGLDNLVEMVNENLEIHQTDGVFVVILGGNFEASLLMIDELWDDSLAFMVEQSFVACVPARDILAFCDSGSQEGIEKLKDLVDRAWELDCDHRISKDLYFRENATWKRFVN